MHTITAARDCATERQEEIKENWHCCPSIHSEVFLSNYRYKIIFFHSFLGTVQHKMNKKTSLKGPPPLLDFAM